MKPEELGAWQALLQEEFEKPYWQTLSERVDTAYAASAVYPPREALFAAFRLTPPEAVRAVILGQDPYHEPGQANGLAFSVKPGGKLPPALMAYSHGPFRLSQFPRTIWGRGYSGSGARRSTLSVHGVFIFSASAQNMPGKPGIPP